MSSNNGSVERSRLKAIAAGADFDVARIQQGEGKRQEDQGQVEGELNRRQERLREKLDAWLEKKCRKLFGKTKRRKRGNRKQKENGSLSDVEDGNGIRLFKETGGWTNSNLGNRSPPKQRPRRKRRKEEKKDERSQGEDGVWRLRGLAVMGTDDILANAKRFREEGMKNLLRTSESSSSHYIRKFSALPGNTVAQ